MLTKREQEVMELLIQGLSNREISEKLIIACHTTKAHISSIFAKLKVNNRVQAIVKYLNCPEKYKYCRAIESVQVL